MVTYNHRRMNTSAMVCSVCGKVGIPVMRPLSQQREKNHKKTIYCIYCKKATIHIEKKEKLWYV